MGRYPWAEVLLFQVLSIAVFYPTRHRVYRISVVAAMIYFATQIYQTPEVTDPVKLTYCVGINIAFHFVRTVHIMCADESFPGHWRRTRDEVHAEADAGDLSTLPSSFSLTKKLWWMFDLAYSPRTVGWVQEPRNSLPPHPPPSC
jgi:hypothetical protein